MAVSSFRMALCRARSDGPHDNLGATRTVKILFVIPCDTFMPSGIVRVRNYLPYLRAKGIEYSVTNYFSPLRLRLLGLRHRGDGSLRPRLWRGLLHVASFFVGAVQQLFYVCGLLLRAPDFDAVFLQWVVPSKPVTCLLAGRAKKLIFDFDDAIFVSRPSACEALVRRAWRVVAGSHCLYEYALRHNPNSILIPSAVPVDQFPAPRDEEYKIESRPVRIGWIGSPSTAKYLALFKEVAARLRESGFQFLLVLAGVGPDRRIVPDLGPIPIEYRDAYRAEEIPTLVSQLDIGILPLADGPWERGKCAMKALIYMARGKPCVCSRVGENVYVIQDGTNGFLADDPDEWAEKLRALMTSEALRREIGCRGRQTIEDQYTTARCFDKLYTAVFQAL